jgi:multiple sugar transport system ATP-binding protein
MAEVILENVKKIYADDGFVAVEDFNLHIKDREFVVLVGPSGCGKSTTLRMVAGLEEISGGTVAIDGRVVNDVPPKDRDIAMVFQNYALYPHMTVFDNMAFGLKLRHMKKSEIMERVREAADILGLHDLLDRRPKALSGGQRQRVAVGRAIVRKPKVFLFDEPLSNLDAKMRVQMRVEINRLHHKLGATMIYVTHDQTEAMTMGDRIVVMEKGRVQQVADPMTLYRNPANRFVAGFIGMPPMNFFEGVVEKAGGGFRFRREGMDLELPETWGKSTADHVGATVSLGIRPEDIGSSLAAATPGMPGIAAVVDVTEPMGAETYVYAKAGGGSFISRVEGGCDLRPGSTATLPLYMPHAHLFDANGVLVA